MNLFTHCGCLCSFVNDQPAASVWACPRARAWLRPSVCLSFHHCHTASTAAALQQVLASGGVIPPTLSCCSSIVLSILGLLPLNVLYNQFVDIHEIWHEASFHGLKCSLDIFFADIHHLLKRLTAPFYFVCSFVNDQLTLFMCIYFWALFCSVNLSILSSKPHYVCNCSIVVGVCLL